MNKFALTVLMLLVFSTIPSLAQATRTTYYDVDPTMYVEISAPNEVKPYEEFPIYFEINTLYDLDIKGAWAWIRDGTYKKITLLENHFLKKESSETWSSINKTIMYKVGSGYYPRTVDCELELWYGRHNSSTYEDVRLTFTVGWTSSSTYEELTQVIQERENELSACQSMYSRLVGISIGTTIVLIATTVYFARRKPKS